MLSQVVGAREISVSPNGAFSVVEIGRVTDGRDAADKTVQVVDLHSGRAVYQVKTPHRFVEAFWSSDGKWLAINDEVANSGDYVSVFRLHDRKCEVVKGFGSNAFFRRFAKCHRDIHEKLERITFAARKWDENGVLIVECFGYRRVPTGAREPFDFTWYVDYRHRGEPGIEEFSR